MSTNSDVAALEADWIEARAQRAWLGKVSSIGGVLLSLLVVVAAVEIGRSITDGRNAYLVASGLMLLITAPLIFLIHRTNAKRQDQSDDLVEGLTRQLSAALAAADQQAGQRSIQARRQEFESRLANALDMAEGEPEVLDVIERAFASMLPHSSVELLLADNSQAHLLRMAGVSSADAPSGCTVNSPNQCPAARRAQVQIFDDSESLDACPKLRGRTEGPISAVCVPVSIMGRTVGVIHTTDEPHATYPDDTVPGLGTLAKLAGARIGLLRVMAETQLQAATDSLTGLLNRRSFERRVSEARRDGLPLTIAMADLDNFKTLNDSYGHDTGDRALRLFAQVLTGSLRSHDLISRHGGEEFVIALAGCTSESARTILTTLQTRLDAAITVAGLPKFTVSVGVIEGRNDEDLPTMIARADAALFEAKASGRNRVLVHGAQGNAVPAPIGTARGRLTDADA